jgi:hypothetical protein
MREGVVVLVFGCGLVLGFTDLVVGFGVRV